MTDSSNSMNARRSCSSCINPSTPTTTHHYTISVSYPNNKSSPPTAFGADGHPRLSLSVFESRLRGGGGDERPLITSLHQPRSPKYPAPTSNMSLAVGPRPLDERFQLVPLRLPQCCCIGTTVCCCSALVDECFGRGGVAQRV